MSTATNRTRKPVHQLGLSPEQGNEIVALLLVFAAMLLTGSLLSYHPLDPSVLHRVADENARTHNLIGPVGAQLAAVCFSFFGLTSLLLPVLLTVAAWRRVLGQEEAPKRLARALGILALLPALPGMLQLLVGEIPWRGELLDAGGAIGVVVTQILTARLNFGGAFVVLLAVLLVGGNLAVQSTLKDLVQVLRDFLQDVRDFPQVVRTLVGEWKKTKLLARQSAKLQDLSRLDEILAALPEGERGFLRQTRRVREMAHEIATLQTRLDTLDRSVLREPLARLLCREIERFRDRVAGFRQPLARGFGAAAGNWIEVAQKQRADAQAVLEKEPARQVFRAGDPVDREREAFVPRNAVSGEIERQVMLATGCPGIILYGRRRTGKSTVLRNLDPFLPPQVLRAGVSMQKPDAFASLGDLVATLTGALDRAVEGLEPAADAGELRHLFRHLEAADRHLEAADRRLLLSIDEYENLDRKIGEGVFPEDLLATLRESIQTHRHITWIFAGSHEITELPHAPWASYLVSARTVEVEPFTAAETRLLLTEPLKHSTLWPKDDPTRPRFEPGFWGEGGIERIHAEAGGWPHLVQLVAETVVDLLNDDRRTAADAEIVERALDKAVVRGHTVLHQLMRGESTLPGEWDYLAVFRRRSTQPPPADEAVARSLRRRLLVAEDDGGWRLRVPLMERWLRQRG